MLPPPKAVFHPGLVVNEEFFDYKSLELGAKNHLMFSRFRLGSGPFYGVHSGIQLFNMQVGHADRHEGLMIRGYIPKACVTIAVMQTVESTLCIDRWPLQAGQIMVSDDSGPYEFASGGRVRMGIVSVRKATLAAAGIALPDTFPCVYEDADGAFSSAIDAVWQTVLNNHPGPISPDTMEAMETGMIASVANVFKMQRQPEPQHGIGALAAFEARDFILDQLDEPLPVGDLAERFGVTYRTLESAFAFLFGTNPKRLGDRLRLNCAHEELCGNDSRETSVSEVAMKWGFMHLGRFSQKHREVFGTYPKEELGRFKSG